MARSKKPRAAAAEKALHQSPARNEVQGVYSLEFDGASKGNPGKAGAGALLRSPDGSVLCNLKEALGISTCNAAEYRALILGLRAALDRGIQHIRVQGDSNLVFKQMNGQWKVRNKDLAILWMEAKSLRHRFKHFSIHHVTREHNSAADILANAATKIPCVTVKVPGDGKSMLVQKQDLDPAAESVGNSVMKPAGKKGNTQSVHMRLQDSAASTSFGREIFNANCEEVQSLCSLDAKKGHTNVSESDSINLGVYQLEFDGASKGNPGQAGAGAVLRHPDGTVLCEHKKGLGIATCNAAEYCALIVGLQAALERGILCIKVQGDSKLVCKQIRGEWKVHSENLAALYAEAMELVTRFQQFSIHHVYRELNSAADALANAAVLLPETKLISASSTNPAMNSILKVDGIYGKLEEGIAREIDDGQIEQVAGDSCSQEMMSPHLKEMKVASKTGIEKTAYECSEVFLPTLDEVKEKAYQLEYDGASIGNPGKGGVGALLRCSDGSVQLELREGLGTATWNVAHYQALVIGLQTALDYGVSEISVQGDSDLVFKQMIGKCKVKDQNLLALWKEANELRRRFKKFSICKVDKESNAAACALANEAIQLPEACSRRFGFMISNGNSSRDGNPTQGPGNTRMNFKRTEHPVESRKKVSNSISIGQSYRACCSCKIMSGSSYNNQARLVYRSNVPRALGLPFSIAMSKSMGQSVFAATKSLVRVARHWI